MVIIPSDVRLTQCGGSTSLSVFWRYCIVSGIGGFYFVLF